jgi:hypothetical protein
MVTCDPTNRVSFPAIASGATITGFGVPVGTTVVGSVAAGDTTLTMSAVSTENDKDVTMTIGGVTIDHCNVTFNSNVVTITRYHCWSVFDGLKDETNRDGTGGTFVLPEFETPWLDFGLPDDWKDLDRISYSAEGDSTSVNVSIKADPGGKVVSFSIETVGGGADWAPDTGSGPNDLEWDVGDWAFDEPTTAAYGIPLGTIGRRFKITVSAVPTGEHRPTGMELVGTLLPDKEYNA